MSLLGSWMFPKFSVRVRPCGSPVWGHPSNSPARFWTVSDEVLSRIAVLEALKRAEILRQSSSVWIARVGSPLELSRPFLNRFRWGFVENCSVRSIKTGRNSPSEFVRVDRPCGLTPRNLPPVVGCPVDEILVLYD